MLKYRLNCTSRVLTLPNRPVSRSKDSGNGLATGLSNANRNRESQDTSNSGSDHVGITHSQDERRTIKRVSKFQQTQCPASHLTDFGTEIEHRCQRYRGTERSRSRVGFRFASDRTQAQKGSGVVRGFGGQPS
jgi:hypothetical protein